MDSRSLMAEIKADGWELIRINGSHPHFVHPTKKGLVTIPHPKKDLPIKTVKSIRKQAGLTVH
ncbi:type II toxin-antitoxin system HicA family toxin [Pantoea dispersa]|uniref:type II toxin-antitoxin system HicA family toxin n=1 Tax=Pantoea dispersa TaxID=59814 RepID=UPI001CA6717A|nr:type II toxin-antitoxin system HicA family toxin [Pantoea dispersa]QZY96241.1 type II toxin-antitoxin system HicA family toxin [Pantoea dispersa]